MTTRILVSAFGRLLMAAVLGVSSTACGSELLRTGRAPVYLVVSQVEAQQGSAGTFTSFLMSDVRTEGSVVNDNVRLTLRIEPKNPSIPLTAINAVTMTSYRVVFRRTDGQNRPGIDVPFGFSGGVTATVTSGATTSVSFEIVRHQSKEESPLRQMAGLGGASIISTVAEITIYGRDQNGNEVSATAFLDVHFGDFADPT